MHEKFIRCGKKKENRCKNCKIKLHGGGGVGGQNKSK